MGVCQLRNIGVMRASLRSLAEANLQFTEVDFVESAKQGRQPESTK